MNSEVIKMRLKNHFLNQNESGKVYLVSIEQKKRLSVKKLLKLLVWGFLLIMVCSVFLFDKAPFVSWVLMLGYLYIFVHTFYLKIKSIFFTTGKPYEATLRNFIYKNNLFDADSNDDILNEITLGYVENKDAGTLSVIVGKDGGKYQEVADNLAEKLASALKLDFYAKKSQIDSVVYVYRTVSVQRYAVDHIPLESEDMRIKIYGDQELSLRQNFSTLISGASGSGKSYFTYNIWADIVSKYVIRDGKEYHAKAYVIDPKMSDIYKHCVLSGYPENMYGSTVADAFKIIREFTEELEKRKKIYADIDEFDKTLLDLGYEPQILLVDEYPSLVAQMDSKQLKDWEAKLGNIARLSRQLSQGVILIMQQAGAGENGLPTSIREQLVNRVFLGNSESISQQSSEMVFGQSKKDLPSPLFAVGEGLMSIDGNTPTSFLAPQFTVDVKTIVQPVLANAVINWKDSGDTETSDKNWEELL